LHARIARNLYEPTVDVLSFGAALRLVTDQVEESRKAPATGDHNLAKGREGSQLAAPSRQD
jgi:hypothetical protein